MVRFPHMIAFVSFFLVLCLFNPPIFSRDSTAAVWQSYIENPNKHLNIPNNSFAGYQYGEAPIPNYPVVVNAQDFGAVGDGKTESSKAINDALKAASQKGGGAVLLPAGTYLLTKEIRMNYDGVVLRGAGPGKTVLKIEKPLSETFNKPTRMHAGNTKGNGNSEWEESGGFIRFTPEAETPSNAKSSWKYTINDLTAADAEKGDEQIIVVNGNRFAPGDRVIILFEDDPSATFQREIFRGLKLTHPYDWRKKDPKIFKTNLLYPLEIAAVSGKRITFKQPLRLPVKKGTKIALIRELVQNSGVESLSIILKGNNQWVHHREIGYNGIYFNCAWNCWARDIDIVNAENSILLFSSKCITIKNVAVKGLGTHHGFYMARSSDNLVMDFRIEAKIFHGIALDSFAHGNVYCNGVMDHGTFDYHRGLAFDNIITNIRIHNDGTPGGGMAPRFGARNVHWNVTVTNGRANWINPSNLMPCGAVVGVAGCKVYEDTDPDYEGDLNTLIESIGERVEPENLFLAQVALRLSRLPEYLKE